jgi:hypothetical protein
MWRSMAPPSAEPPPITLRMPYLSKKSKARSEPLWIGLSAFDPLSGYDPNAEGWQFPPLTEVRCVKRKFMVGTDQLGFKLNFYRHLTSAQTALNRAQAQ